MQKKGKLFRLNEDVIDMIERRDLQKFPFENLFIEAAIRNFMKQENEKILVEEFEKINQKLDELLSRTNEKTVDDILDLNTLR